MKLIEAPGTIEPSSSLAHARQQLRNGFADQNLSVEGYESLVTGYINATQREYFDPDSTYQYARFIDVARVLQHEIDRLADAPTCGVLDIVQLLKGYCQDERAKWLHKGNYPVLPRAAVHTLLDLVDAQKPRPFGRKRY